MPTAKWARINPAGLLMLGQKGGIMLMGVSAGKHVTIFPRSRRAKHAGRLEVKNAFREIAKGTLGIESRVERNMKVQGAMLARGLKRGVYTYRSRAKPESPLFGKVSTRGKGK